MLITRRMAAVCCCLFGGIICAFLPYCMQMCHDAHHFCTSCGQKVAYAPHDAPVQVFGPLNPGSVVVPPAPVKAPEAVAKN
jgi:lipopolysaccharide-induced tumor necrosis factor-alpha factor